MRLPAPASLRPRAGMLAVLILAVVATAKPAEAFKVTTWNLWQYPNGSLPTRQPLFRTVMQNLDTDVIMVQELLTSAGADSFLFNVLRVANPGRVWKNAGYILNAESTVFYDSLTVSGITNRSSIEVNGPRQVYQVFVIPRGYAASAARLRLFSVHYKAGNTVEDSDTRLVECTNLRAFLNAQVNSIPNILHAGDTNFYGDWEGGYQVLLESQADNDGRLRDSATLPGTWNQFGYRFHHSQAPCLSGCLAGQSTGGLDDRFDFFLFSYPMLDGEGVDFISQTPYGNDGQHYNESVNQDGRNDVVPIQVADALKLAADHLPVVATIQLPAKIVAASQLNLGTIIVGGGASQNLAVSNGATLLPVDELTYSFSPPAGFTAPAGTFQHSATFPANNHSIGLLGASSGLKTGTLTIACDDVDSLSKPVLLSGTVLDHAAASLDSASAVPSDTIDFGIRVPGDFNDQPVRVHNRGYDALQARLSVDAAQIVDGDGRFSIVGGFSTALLSGTGKTYPIHFDDSGATLDQTYEATLTIDSSDEPLPGAQPQPDLTVLLRAYPKSVTGVEASLPRVVSFLPARPNPLAGDTYLGFELPRAAKVRLEVFDLSGRVVTTLAAGDYPAGRHGARWGTIDASGARVSAGLYFARFTTDGFRGVQRLIVLP